VSLGYANGFSVVHSDTSCCFYVTEPSEICGEEFGRWVGDQIVINAGNMFKRQLICK
jgi:hypothetical protein